MAADLYSALGVSRDATDDDIKKAYRKLARKFHPDVNPDDKAAEDRFKEISAAFEVLSDPEKRRLYDEFGEDSLKSGFNPDEARAYQAWRQRAGASSAHRARAANFADGYDLSDLFEGFSPFGNEPRGPQPGQDLRTHMHIQLREAVLGGEREIRLERPRRCETCGGTGRRETPGARPCETCEGTGRIHIARGPMSFYRTCPTCAGTGHVPGIPCSTCGGEGVLPGQVTLKVKIPPGVVDGQTIRLAGQGMPGTRGGEQWGAPGDLLIDVSVAPHPLLRREGRDLYLDLPVTVLEAMRGALVQVPTFQGDIKVKVPPGSQSGTKLRIRGRGIRGDPPGDLYAVLQVRLPPGDAETAQKAAAELERHYAKDVRASLAL